MSESDHQPDRPKFRNSEQEIDAVIYVGVVLLVYAFIIMLMIASNIRRQRMDAEGADFYEEFLQKREEFKNEMLYHETRKLQNQAPSVSVPILCNGKDGKAPLICITEV